MEAQLRKIIEEKIDQQYTLKLKAVDKGWSTELYQDRINLLEGILMKADELEEEEESIDPSNYEEGNDLI